MNKQNIIKIQQIVVDEFVESVSKGEGLDVLLFVTRGIEMTINCKMQGFGYDELEIQDPFHKPHYT